MKKPEVCFDLIAGEAFGSGAHESTRGALAAMDFLRQQEKRFHNILDMGCGSGILSLVAAQIWQMPILAVDINEKAVEATRENTKHNGLTEYITAIRSDGYKHETIRVRAPYDLILCNIIAEPLIQMAGDAAKHLAPGGSIVLSGVLVWLQPQVQESHEAAGLRLDHVITVGDWRTLVMKY